MSRRTKVEREHEAERQRLAAELEANGETPELLERIARWAAVQVERTWSHRGVDARRLQASGTMFANLYRESGVDDAEPASMTTIRHSSGALEVFVRSHSRGRVSIGILSGWAVAEVLDAVEPLDQSRAAHAATETLQARTARRRRRTAELAATGLGLDAIGRQIAVEEGRTTLEGEPDPFPLETVRQWRWPRRRTRER